MHPDGAASVAHASLSESTVEAVALDWLGSLGWTVLHGPDIAPDTPGAERADYGEVVLHGRLRSALARLNPDLPDEALDDALHRLTRPAGATLEARNRDFHRMLVAGVTVEYADADGRVRGDHVRVLDFDEPNRNDWLAVNQFTIVENRHERRPDIVLFINGLPLAVIELKNPADENATIHTAFKQLQTYKAEVLSLFAFNAALIVSDGVEARIGTLTAGWEWFKRWRTIAGETLADPSLPQLRVLLEGDCDPRRLLALVRDFIVFEDDGSGALVKKMAGYHQFHAVQAESRADLRAKLAVESGGVVFTTIQKFFPEEKGDRHPRLSDRRNIVVIADEAHRSQYDFIDGYARHMRDALPNASFIGFTGTPIELADASTRAVFGDHISVYDIQRAVDDEATVPIYYESRLAELALDKTERPRIDAGFEEVTEGEEADRREKLKTKWAQLEAVVGAEQRVALIARDIVEHFESRTDAMDGKAMVVCMSRRICIDLYRELVRLRPAWRDDDDTRGALKVVMTGQASDPPDWQAHIGNKARREALAKRFRDPADPLRMVLVRDMWLTGFDAPSLHTMYVDKPMRGHGLMQAIARVNRVFRDKPGGLVVDYLGLAHELKRALATYTENGGKGQTAVDMERAVRVTLEKYEVCCGLLHGFDRTAWTTGSPADRLNLLPAALEHVLAQEDGKARCLKAVRELSQAFALAVPHPETVRIRDDVSLFQHVRAALSKRTGPDAKSDEGLDHAVRQIVSRAVASDGVVDIFAAAGLKKPDVSVLSEEFLREVRGMRRRNLAVELMEKLLKGELATRRRKNVVQARSFAEMLEQTIRRYQNRAVEAAQVIEELIGLAREMREANARGERLGLSDDELAFYDALGVNDSAVQVLGDETLRENVRANLRRLVKRILRKHGYPPDKQESATRTVLEQAEALSAGWAA